MRRWAWVCVFLLALALPVSAHVALSSLDVHVRDRGVDVAVVAQAFDVAHELGVDPPERLMDLAFLAAHRDAIAKLVDEGIAITVDGQPVTVEWSMPEAAPDQQLVRIRGQSDLAGTPGRVDMASRLFAYDSAHQTLVNVYEGEQLKTQQMLDAGRLQFEYFTSARAGLLSVVRRFGLAGARDVLTRTDHLLFVAALLLLGGSTRRVASILAAFTVSYSAALALGASAAIALPVAVIAPGVALSVVYCGVDNVMIRGGRDVRVAIAIAFGWVHGFSFARTLGAMDRPLRGFVSAAASFNAGVEVGVLLVAVAVLAASALSALQGERARRALAVAGSLAIAAAGAVSFLERLR